MRTISQFMTKQPWSVQVDDSLGVARQMLAAREIHHLPVLDGGRLVGMVTVADLDRARSRATTVDQVMAIAHEVDASTPFGEALALMDDRKCDALVVTSDGEIQGIFTAMDAVHVLRDRMRLRSRA